MHKASVVKTSARAQRTFTSSERRLLLLLLLYMTKTTILYGDAVDDDDDDRVPRGYSNAERSSRIIYALAHDRVFSI